ncbi:Glycosyltransferase involved in cell wall bisynthesis [Nitrosospira multiformis ATCC 25196]|uniref:Glycosyl transferase, group 1 n=1 Tax=Nitrosospira multiformis (strain ATCC 25196 / NCIMB 11849 / C 71) TaxID=323848 RepID=Q2Y6D3_NITMU|nr:glycosyltransferase [Nitrosospira multiformis]ABB75688.1 Glycosyl transferase, group 1 [Nitrosospira multiformis ATCC 25196]SEG17781.1 Glycosyltransferase involved in cell wall bisynthesis [Nitrosospira multiformis ATCC 25196]
MKNLSPTYVFDIQEQLWSRPGYGGINYSDGDDIELQIAKVIAEAADITVLSRELRQHCTDWPFLYHLSASRANILRPFATTLTGDILEIGAGCGAITRYLGEAGANILALEGSPRRAAIARSRTRDLENVTVLAEKFDQFECDHQFDLITLIGVLEYANLFTTGENPALAMLQRVRSLLKPEGTLILAIENQLGLKYFAGALEDHIGQPMYGIEGRYTRNQPQTFGRMVLSNLMKEAGFTTIEFLAPFPDYKLPVSILTEEGLSSKEFDGAALAWQSVRRDHQLPLSTNFSIEMVWLEVFKNGLALDMANSFLLAASPLQQKIVKAGILGYHYSTDRIPQYCKETIFQRIENSTTVNYRMLGSSLLDNRTDQVIKFACPDRAIYAEGFPLSLEFTRLLTSDGWSMSGVGLLIHRYIGLLEFIANQKGHAWDKPLPHRLPGEFFDMVPQNIIIDKNGEPVSIDTEWVLKNGIEAGWLLFRSLLLTIDSIMCFGRNLAEQKFSRREFIISALDAAGFALTNEDFQRFIELEADVQQEVTGRPSHEFVNWRPEHPLPTYSPVKHGGEIGALQSEVGVAWREIDMMRDEIDVARAKIEMLHEELDALYRSTSWRITAPLRGMRRLITRFADRPSPLSLARATLKHGTECYQTKLLADPQVSRQRIVHVIGNFLTGGSSRLVVDLFERLGHLYEQEVVTQYNPDPPNYTGIPIHEFSGGDAWDKFITYLRLYRPDLVHVHYWEDPHWYGTMIKAAREFGCKIIQNVNTPTAPYMDSCISRYIYVSDYVKTRFGKRDQPSITIYPGSNFKLFSRDKSRPVPDDCIGMVYRLDIDKLHRKSIDVFIKVVQKRPQTKVIIVGGGPYLEPYKAAVKAGKVEHAFTFTGFVPYESLIGFYARMSLFVAPVWKESFGQVGPFAMSMGLPVVGYNVGALAEIVGDCGLLAPRGNSEALAEIIIGLLDDKERREQIGSRNRDRAHKLFSVENMVNDYLKLYQELIGNTQ